MATPEATSRCQRAREQAGLTLEAAALRARVTPAYLRQIEKHGGAPYALACRLSHLYGGCPLALFLKIRTKEATTERNDTHRARNHFAVRAAHARGTD